MRLLAPLLALLLVSLAFCQTGNRRFVGTEGFQNTAGLTTAEGLGIGSRFAGMGGAGIAAVDDATSLYWNPAGLAYGRGSEVDIDIFGKVNDIDLLQKLRKGIEIMRRGSGALSPGDIADLLNIAREANDKPLEASAGAIAAFRFHNFALGGWGRAAGNMVVDLTGSTISAGGSGKQVGGIGTAVAPTFPAIVAMATNLGAGWARKWTDTLRLGLTLRQMGMDVREGYASADTTGGTGSVTDFFSDSDRKVTGDIGGIWEPEENIRIGFVARNLGAPSFCLVDGVDAICINTDPSFDLGMAAWSRDGRTLVAADVHNLTGADGGQGSFHIGVEHHFNDWLIFRMGTSTSGWTYGFDLDVAKAALLRMASSSSLGQQIGLGMALRF
jgi:hypothetical protein